MGVKQWGRGSVQTAERLKQRRGQSPAHQRAWSLVSWYCGLPPASSLASPLNAAHLAGILASRSDTELALRQALQEDKQEVPEALAGRRKIPKSRENLCKQGLPLLKGQGRVRSTQSLETAGRKDWGSKGLPCNVRMHATGWYKSRQLAPGHGSISGDPARRRASSTLLGIHPALQIQAGGNGK